MFPIKPILVSNHVLFSNEKKSQLLIKNVVTIDAIMSDLAGRLDRPLYLGHVCNLTFESRNAGGNGIRVSVSLSSGLDASSQSEARGLVCST